MDPLLPPPGGFHEEAPGARTARRYAAWSLGFGLVSALPGAFSGMGLGLTLRGLLLTLAAVLGAWICGILAWADSRRAKVHHTRSPETWVPLRRGRTLVALGLAASLVMPLVPVVLAALPGIALRKRIRHADLMERHQQELGDRARAMRDRFRDGEGRVKLEELAQALIQEAGPQPDPYRGKPAPLKWAPRPLAPGQWTLCRGYESRDPATGKPAPTLFIRAGLVEPSGVPRERTWIVRLE